LEVAPGALEGLSRPLCLFQLLSLEMRVDAYIRNVSCVSSNSLVHLSRHVHVNNAQIKVTTVHRLLT
jgi:hypothetical protein